MQEYLTAANIELVVMTLLAICSSLSMVLSVRSNLRKVRDEGRAPLMHVQESVKEMEKKQKMLERRMEEIEKKSDTHGDKMTLVLRSQLSILSHLVNGNSVEKLRSSLQEINDFLVNR